MSAQTRLSNDIWLCFKLLSELRQLASHEDSHKDRQA